MSKPLQPFTVVIALILLLLPPLNNATENNSSAEVTSINSRIVGGDATTIDKAKYLVYLRVNGKFICGGSLVSTKFVITAAHCIDGVNPSKVIVVGGATRLSEPGVRRGVTKIIKPQNYNKPKPYHMDVAVLKLAAEMKGNNIGTIPLCEANWKFGDYIDVYGWGQLGENNKAQVQQMRQVRVPLVLRSKCIGAYRQRETITDSMFCAGDLAKGKDSCYGDSGGPAVFQNQLCGIVSWGLRCASTKYPGVYTSIKSVRNFIDRAMKQ
ncbi:seminase-like [Musca autumnalis]|uniref:seminase-like n=1 Tax=Musca autumnalis TaxID=221902 RepID=UPI003CFABBAC